jgi:crotonobetaine/carnitine-CoA ligase
VNDLGSLLELRAAEAGQRPFLAMPGGIRLTYAEFNERVNQVAHGLTQAGVARGDRIAIMMRNSVEFLLGSYALKKLGAVEVAINTEFRGAGLAHMLNVPQAALLLTDEEFVEPLAAVRENLLHLRRVAFTSGHDAAAGRLPGLDVCAFADLVSARGDNPGVEVRGSELGTILFASGTTGVSKGCMLPHRYAVKAGEVIVERLGLRADDCLYCPFPLYHVDAAYLTVAPAIVLGARVGLGRRFSASGFWDEVRELEGTVFDFMGATLTILHKRDPLPTDADNPVRLAWGVPMPAWRSEFEARFNLKLVHCYGLTDGNMVAYENPDGDEPAGSCGTVHPSFDVRILDDDDREVTAGTVGEIAIRPNEPDIMMMGYYGMPEASLAAFRNQWFHTGDHGRVDADGHLFFESRKKDAIRRRGENISAFEIEEVVNTHPAVLECAAIGVPSELTEEDVKVVVVLRNGTLIDAEELREFCRTRMARFMVPEHVEFVDAIPKTPTGKVEKYKLR